MHLHAEDIVSHGGKIRAKLFPLPHVMVVFRKPDAYSRSLPAQLSFYRRKRANVVEHFGQVATTMNFGVGFLLDAVYGKLQIRAALEQPLRVMNVKSLTIAIDKNRLEMSLSAGIVKTLNQIGNQKRIPHWSAETKPSQRLHMSSLIDYR
jgi:hypothetical protein